MAIFQVPIDSTAEVFVQETDLDGRTFRLEFHWNDREGEWYMHVFDADDVAVAYGVKMVTGINLLRLVDNSDRRPPGDFILDDPEGVGSPGRNDLGTRVFLMYLDEDEIVPDSVGDFSADGGLFFHASMSSVFGETIPALNTWLPTRVWSEDLLGDGWEIDGEKLRWTGETRTFLFLMNGTFSLSAVGNIRLTISHNNEIPSATDGNRFEHTTSDPRTHCVGRVLTMNTNDVVDVLYRGSAAGIVTFIGQLKAVG
jgi:hypothetical protein